MTLPELETYFSSIELPETLKLNAFSFCSDLPALIESNITYLKANPGNKTFMPYYKQLLEIRDVLLKK